MTHPDRSTLLREPNFRWMMGGSLISAFLAAGLFLVAYSLLAYTFTNISRITDTASIG